jgi:hypothetical protein
MITPLDLTQLPTPGKQRVLVAVLPSPADLVMADQQGWYRVPVAHAPAQLGADYLAFYQTGAFPTGEKWQVSLLTVVRRVRITTRAELLPEEADHPRAQARYFRIDIGPLWQLPQPIPSRRLRRITFIPTTLARLLAAREINGLWDKGEHQDRLWHALLEAGLEPERQLPWGEVESDEPWQLADGVAQPPIDFGFDGTRGRLAVMCPSDQGLRPVQVREAVEWVYDLAAAGWQTMWLAERRIWQDLAGCVAAVRGAVEQLAAAD